MSLRPAVAALAAVAVIGAAVVLVWSAVATSGARVTASTSGTSFFSAGTVELAQPDSSVDLLFDADGLYPGLTVSGCVEIEYRGTLPASVRLHASRRGGDGLEAYIETTVTILDNPTCSPPGGAGLEPTGQLLFEGRLGGLWTDHRNYDTGLQLADTMIQGDRIAIEAEATVVDDNGAQGLTTDFALTIEARP